MQDFNPLEIIDRVFSEMEEAEQAERTVFTGAYLLSTTVESLPMLWEPFLPTVGTGAIVGIPDSGKSQFCRQLAIAITCKGAEDIFLGKVIRPRYHSVIYVFTEDSEQATQFCLQRQCEGMGVNRDDNMEALRFVKGESYSTPELLDKLESMLQECPADLIIIDTFGDVFMGQDSNNNVKMRETVRDFNRIAQKHQLLVLFIHHLNKSAYHLAPEQSQVQGGAGFVQKVRVVLDLRNGRDEEKYLFVTKGNYVSRSYKQQGMVLLFDEDTLLFTDTGEFVEREEIQTVESSSAMNSGMQIDWQGIFCSDRELKRKIIVDGLVARYNISVRTAGRLINRDLTKVVRGMYSCKLL